MKRYRLIIFLLFLSANIKTFACYNYEDDYWDGGQLPGVDIYPDHGNDNYDDDNDEWWNDENDDDYGYEDYEIETDENDYEWEDASYYPVNDSGNSKSNEYTIKSNDLVVKNNLPENWEKQNTKHNCVTTAMEYVSKILNFGSTREGYEYDYKNEISQGRDARDDGVLKSDLEDFVKYEFQVNDISLPLGVADAIKNGWPILIDLEGRSNGIFPTCGHEVVIIGIVSDSSNTYIYVDPSDGKYKTIPYWDISKNSKAYAIKDKNNP